MEVTIKTLKVGSVVIYQDLFWLIDEIRIKQNGIGGIEHKVDLVEYTDNPRKYADNVDFAHIKPIPDL